MTPDSILHKHQLRRTAVRIDVLSIFITEAYAMTQAMLENQLGKSADRVTLYRTLRTFEDKGILHRVADDGENIRFALCRDTCTEHHHADNHVHFTCQSCKHTFCLDHVTIPEVKLPGQYTVSSMQFIVSGLCPNCSSTN